MKIHLNNASRKKCRCHMVILSFVRMNHPKCRRGILLAYAVRSILVTIFHLKTDWACHLRTSEWEEMVYPVFFCVCSPNPIVIHVMNLHPRKNIFAWIAQIFSICLASATSSSILWKFSHRVVIQIQPNFFANKKIWSDERDKDKRWAICMHICRASSFHMLNINFGHYITLWCQFGRH